MKVLMATDGSKETLTALRTASRLLNRNNCQVDVLCVAPEFRSPEGKKSKDKISQMRKEYQRRISQETDRITEQARSILREEGIEAGVIASVGSPAEVITRMAEDYDVTVVGATGRDEHRSFGLGPVASRVVQRAPGTVLVIRGDMPVKRLKILAGVDGSRVSERALDSLIANFNLDEAEITLMHVRETPWIHVGLDREWFAYPEDVTNDDSAMNWEWELNAEASELIESARDRLAALPISVMTTVNEGNPGTEMLGEAEGSDYDLIVVGATGASDIKHNLLGSVSTKLAWYAPCSVAIVRQT